MEITLSRDSEKAVLGLVRSGRMPHTVIIQCSSKEERDGAAMLLAAGAVCESDIGGRPCLRCAACRKALDGNHPDLIIPPPSKTSKTGILSLKELREQYLSQAYIKPNEAPLKVYIFRDADRLLREDSQNTLLKLIEEPPQPLLFIFTVSKARSLLLTVRSRAHLIALHEDSVPDPAAVQAAEEIASGIVSMYEYDLLKALSALSDKAIAEAALTQLIEKLRLCMGILCGVSSDDPAAQTLARKLDRRRTAELHDATADAIAKLKTNVNLQLLITRLCTVYRRITWQR